ncbi:MAG: hypothetical protein K0R66_483 [Gammaproteobacteria bacterium]|jgi:hypothetical protein|nr:hypothetical protein [Gammaproteobacteria bacterium]
MCTNHAAAAVFLPQHLSTRLTEAQARGMATGLNLEQVNQPWFGEAHARAAEKGIAYSEYAKLDAKFIDLGILKGWTREELKLCKIRISETHPEGMLIRSANAVAKRAARAGLTREFERDLARQGCSMISDDLVHSEAHWRYSAGVFMPFVEAVERGMAFRDISHLRLYQVRGVLKYGLSISSVEGLTPKQVKSHGERYQQRLALSMATHSRLGGEASAALSRDIVEEIGRFL